jgi:hypothetical protein
MKSEERTYPGLVEATRGETSAPDEVSEEVVIADDWTSESGPTDQVNLLPPDELDRSGRHVAGKPAGAKNERKTEERKAVEVESEQRRRRSTLVSPIPAMVAEWMRKETGGGVPVARDPDGSEQGIGDHTRPLAISSEQEHFDAEHDAAYTVELVDDGNAERRQRAARLIDRARACLESHDVPSAVEAAEGALDEADQAAPPGIVEVIEPARPLLTRIFATYVGSLTEVPVLARRLDEIAGMALDERQRSMIGCIDGIRSLDQIFDGARVPSADALRITASLMRAGVIRVV